MSALIGQFKTFYRDLRQLPFEQFGQIYADDVIFRDPVGQLRSAAALMSYLESSCQQLQFGQFEYLDELVDADTAYIKWNMQFSHPKYRDGVHTLRGMSHLQFGDRIHYHEDVYDLGQMVYEHVPVMGSAVRWLKRRLM